MEAYELYRRYRVKLEELSLAQPPQGNVDTDIPLLMQQFESEASELEPRRLQQLCEYFCEQLEHEAAVSMNPQRRHLMLRAAKMAELMIYSVQQR